MVQEDWRLRTRQLHNQVAAITGRDLKLWLFTFTVVLVLAVGVLLLGFSNLTWTRQSRSAFVLAGSLVLVLLIFTGHVLHRRHTYTSAREELIRELIYSERLQSLSMIDPLTQVFNVCYLDQVLPREINRANRQGSTITFMLVELMDRVKANGVHGELLRDQMLFEAAQFLKNTFRGSDIVLRYDLRRFLVILCETNEHQAGCALKRMLERLDSWNLETHTPFELDFRVGMAGYSRGASVQSVLKLAEERLESDRPSDKQCRSHDLADCGVRPSPATFRQESQL